WRAVFLRFAASELEVDLVFVGQEHQFNLSCGVFAKGELLGEDAGLPECLPRVGAVGCQWRLGWLCRSAASTATLRLWGWRRGWRCFGSQQGILHASMLQIHQIAGGIEWLASLQARSGV